MRNFIYSILIVSCVVINLNGQDTSPITNSARLLKRDSEGYCTQSDRDTWKCQDCQTVQYCDGNSWSEYSFTCSSQFPGRPYCNKAAKDIADMCVSDESVCDPDPMPCPAEGIFPCVRNCKAYHLCLAKDSQSIPYFCKYSTIYNHASKSCRLNSPCYTVTSECGTQSKIIPYRLDNSLYVICTGYWNPILKSCPRGLRFDPASVKCEFECPGEGVLSNPLDSKSFYMCYLDGDVLRKEFVHCPNGATFDTKKKHCSFSGTTSGTDTSYPVSWDGANNNNYYPESRSVIGTNITGKNNANNTA